MDVLGVEAFRQTVSGNVLVGSYCRFSNQGGIVHPRTTVEDLDELSSLLQVPLVAGTINRGSDVIAAGLEQVIQWLNQFEFRADDLEYLAKLTGNNGEALFEPAFLTFLQNMRLGLHIQAMPEGTLAFPNEPILRVSGPLIQAQLVETALLNMINFQT